MPVGWEVKRGPEEEPDKSVLAYGNENLTVGFRITNRSGFAEHNVFKFKNVESAKNGFQRIKQQGYFTPRNGVIPSEWNYKSKNADEWYFGCNDQNMVWCVSIARYGEYISIFETSIIDNCMTLDDMEGVLRTIDKLFAQGLTKKWEKSETDR
jgi:hypothetical protein